MRISMMMKRLFGSMALVVLTTIPASAETLTEVEEVQAEQQEKATIELPAWVKNITLSGYGMLQYQGHG